MSEFDELSQKWNPYIENELNFLGITQMLLSALVIVKEQLAPDIFRAAEPENQTHPPRILRLVSNVVSIMAENRHAFMEQMKECLLEDPETVEVMEEFSGPISMDNDQSVERALIHALSFVVINTEQVYADLFFGSHDAVIFHQDLRGEAVWKRQQVDEADERMGKKQKSMEGVN